MTKFSVLMSIYKKENPQYFRECIRSLLTQTVQPDQIVLVEDGALTEELDAMVEEFRNLCPVLKVVAYPENRGLGRALADGLLACDYPLVARMDTDDIAFPDRFARQLRAFEENPALDICGGHVLEFTGSTENILRRKQVPVTHEAIVRYAGRRNPFNHPSVMYKRQAVLDAGNYQDCPGFEDYYLWARMIANGAQTANIDDYILYFRAGEEMYQRRGGWKYMKDAVKARWKIYRLGVSSLPDFAVAAGGQIVVSLMPNRMRGSFYRKMLRK
jgi:glycosyltransferase involved in cell wall biosynthesis